MSEILIKVSDYISCNKGITPDEAEPIYQKEMEVFKNGNTVILDFSDIELITTAFLNVLVGNLYKDFTSEQLRNMIQFSNITEIIARRIKKVTDNAKAFYSDQESYGESVNTTINGSN